MEFTDHCGLTSARPLRRNWKMPKALTHSELLAEIAKATRNRNKHALSAQHLLEQGKRDEAREMLARADYWEAERKALQRKVKVRKEKKS